jgi:hypothetical protein
MNNVEKIRKPMMVVAGKNDPRVPVSESDQIVASLERNGTPVWYMVAKDEGHGYQKKANGDFEFYATVAFLQKSCSIKRDSTPAVLTAGALPIQPLVRSHLSLARRLPLWGLVFRVSASIRSRCCANRSVASHHDVTAESAILQSS